VLSANGAKAKVLRENRRAFALLPSHRLAVHWPYSPADPGC